MPESTNKVFVPHSVAPAVIANELEYWEDKDGSRALALDGLREIAAEMCLQLEVARRTYVYLLREASEDEAALRYFQYYLASYVGQSRLMRCDGINSIIRSSYSRRAAVMTLLDTKAAFGVMVPNEVAADEGFEIPPLGRDDWYVAQGLLARITSATSLPKELSERMSPEENVRLLEYTLFLGKVPVNYWKSGGGRQM